MSMVEYQTIQSVLFRVREEMAALPENLLIKAHMHTLAYFLAMNPIYKSNFYRLTTNSRCEIRHNIIEPAMVEDFCPSDNGKHDGPHMDADSEPPSIGTLRILPREIFQDVLCQYLDLASLTKIRSVRCVVKIEPADERGNACR